MNHEAAHLVLADGTTFEGIAVGAKGSTTGEAVFTTGMTGYQEILSDPSYAGQIVNLTYPLIGNYGINEDDIESRRIQVSGLVVHHCEDRPSNWRSGQTLHDYLAKNNIVAIKGVDTRAITRHVRQKGVMLSTITCDETVDEALARLATVPSYETADFTRVVTTPHTYLWNETAVVPLKFQPGGARTAKRRIALLDCGVKYNILRSLANNGCETVVFPCTVSHSDILDCHPDGIMLSPGPGDPANLGGIVETVKHLVGKKPILGVCLGNQILGAAFGSKTFKLRFGHRGSNHPVKDLASGKVYITSQNHGYALDPDGLRDGMEVAHVNLNDGTVEGLRHKELPIISIQYHPEASPGPMDSSYFFGEFMGLIDQRS